MKTIDRDYHGYTVDQALFDLEGLLFHTNPNKHSYFRIITGHGPIKSAITSRLDELEIHWDYALNNSGCLLVELPEDL